MIYDVKRAAYKGHNCTRCMHMRARASADFGGVLCRCARGNKIGFGRFTEVPSSKAVDACCSAFDKLPNDMKSALMLARREILFREFKSKQYGEWNRGI